MQVFTGLTVVVLASNERESFRNTLNSIIENCQKSDLAEIIVFLKSSDCPAADEYQHLLNDSIIPIPIRLHVQKQKKLPDALVEIPSLINSSHFIIMFADNATDPGSLPEMLALTKAHPDAIVCASKWHKDSVVVGYGFFRKLGSRCVNKIVAIILHSNGRDLFSLYQIYPKTIIEESADQKDPYQFLCEYTIKPLVNGVPYFEVPTIYKARTEKRTNTGIRIILKTVFLFVQTAVKLKYC